MKTILAVLCVLLTVNLFSATCDAADSPVSVTHKLVRYEAGPELAILEYTLHVVNNGEKPLSSLSLHVVRSQILRPQNPMLKIGTLAPGESTDLSLVIETPADVGKERVLRQPILLEGRCHDPRGKLLEFPARSHPGGAR